MGEAQDGAPVLSVCASVLAPRPRGSLRGSDDRKITQEVGCSSLNPEAIKKKTETCNVSISVPQEKTTQRKRCQRQLEKYLH